jgi:uncharacterized membrane protein SpoIIM required for sporulation
LAAVDEFIAAHRGDWDELELLLRRAGQEPRRLAAAEIERLGRLYRHVASDLALARRDFPADQTARYLNDLAARTHPLLYRSPAGSWKRLGRFWTADFPCLVRTAQPFVLVSFLLFALPALAGFLVVVLSPTVGDQILPPRLTAVVREGRLWTEIPEDVRPLAASTIMTNNIQVAILAFGGGMLLGTLTVYVLVMNGLMLGTIFGYTQAYGLGADLAAFVSPHGYLELGVVFLAGGAGLQMAWAIINPGFLNRRDALSLAAHRAVLLIVGAIPLLVLAGLIEGFISPSGLPNWVKYLIGPLTAVALSAYLVFCPRSNVVPSPESRVLSPES